VTDRYAEVKARAREGWSRGDYPRLGAILEPASQELLDACAISAGQEVLDVACGNGNLAVLAAREGAAVVGSDLTPRMLELAEQRARAEDLDIEWVEGDAEALPFEDERFDCAASVFGAMFAPSHERVAAELFRVVVPGGTVGMANWVPTAFQAEFFGIMTRYGPPTPEGIEPSVLWGDEAVVRSRFDGLASSISYETRSLPFEFESFEAMGEFFRNTGPRQSQLMESLEPERLQQMVAELTGLVERFNQRDDGSVLIENEYAVVVARKRG
jgi:SAM-dependent methyltransferase